MATAQETLGVEIIVEGINKFLGDMKRADGAVSDSARSMGAAGRVAGTFGDSLKTVGTIALGGLAAGATAAVAGVAGLGVAIAKLTIDAASLVNIEAAFAGLADAAGVGMDDMLAALQRGSDGMVSNRDLMLAFNEAAQLVSLDFATKLPDAMQYLEKVSASTGASMDHLLDSLVTGVGRLSPMILDNLAIQVDATAAYQDYADSIGVATSELSKEQKQTAMMNQVLELLARNTDAMPVVAGTAAVAMAAFGVSIKNTKDEIGKAFEPILNKVMGLLGRLGEMIFPRVIAGAEWLARVILPVAEAFVNFFGRLVNGEDALLSFKVLLMNLVPPALFADVMAVVDGVLAFVASTQEAAAPLLAFLAENVKIQDVLAALGIAILTVIIPAIGALISGVVGFAASVVAPFLAVIAIIALLRQAWESNFLGIQDITTRVWEFLKSAFSVGVAVIQSVTQAALEAIAGFWDRNGANIMAIVEAVYQHIQSAIGEKVAGARAIIEIALTAIAAFWDAHGAALLANAEVIWGMIEAYIQTVMANIESIIAAIAAAISGDWETFGSELREIWDRNWQMIVSVFQGIGEILVNSVNSVVESIISLFTETDWGAVGATIIDGIAGGISGAVGAVVGAVRGVVDAASGAVTGFLRGGGGGSVPGGAYQHGGTTSGRGSMLVGERGPELLTGVPGGARVLSSPTTARMGSGGSSVTNNYNLTTNSMTRPGGLQLEFSAMEMGSR